MTEIFAGHDRDPVGSAKRIEVTVTDRERDSFDEAKARDLEGNIVQRGLRKTMLLSKLHGSFEAEIRTSGDASSPPDFIVKGKSEDLDGAHADVYVTDKSGKEIMTITRATRSTMLRGNENASIKFSSGVSATYSGKGRELTYGGSKYTYNTTNKCTQCCYICGALLCFFPTIGIGSCYMMGQMTKAKSTADFKVNDNTIANFNLWFYAEPFKPDEGGCCCGKAEKFDTLLSVDVSDASQWTEDRRWAMLTMAVATCMDTQLEPPPRHDEGGD